MERVAGSSFDGETVLVVCTAVLPATVDRRSTPVAPLDTPTTKGDLVWHMLSGLAPEVR